MRRALIVLVLAAAACGGPEEEATMNATPEEIAAAEARGWPRPPIDRAEVARFEALYGLGQAAPARHDEAVELRQQKLTTFPWGNCASWPEPMDEELIARSGDWWTGQCSFLNPTAYGDIYIQRLGDHTWANGASMNDSILSLKMRIDNRYDPPGGQDWGNLIYGQHHDYAPTPWVDYVYNHQTQLIPALGQNNVMGMRAVDTGNGPYPTFAAFGISALQWEVFP